MEFSTSLKKDAQISWNIINTPKPQPKQDLNTKNWQKKQSQIFLAKKSQFLIKIYELSNMNKMVITNMQQPDNV